MAIHDKVLNTVSLEFSSVARKMAHSGGEMLSLGLGEPGFSTPTEIIEATHKSMLKGETRYASPWGTPELLLKIRNRLNSESVKVDTNELIITVGAKQALSLSLTSILEKEDEVIVISPCFVSFKPQIKMAEPTAIIKEVSLLKGSLDVDFDSIVEAITAKTKAILLNFPNNPTGKVICRKSVQKLVEIAKANDIYIISDEIYSSMIIQDDLFVSFLEYRNEYDKIFVIDGFSKSYSMTGWRIGYLIGPRSHIERVSILQQHLNTNIPVFIQRGAEAALDLPVSFAEKYTVHLKKNSSILMLLIGQSAQLSCIQPGGGMFSFICISQINIDSDSFCTSLLKDTNVAATPGIIFGSEWDDHIRVSLGGNIIEFEEAIKRLVNFADKQVNK